MAGMNVVTGYTGWIVCVFTQMIFSFCGVKATPMMFERQGGLGGRRNGGKQTAGKCGKSATCSFKAVATFLFPSMSLRRKANKMLDELKT